MIYRAKILFLKCALWAARRLQAITRKAPKPGSVAMDVVPNVPRDILAEQIRKYVSGKSFLDAGCMFRIHGAYTFFAEKCGATRSMGLDVFPATPEFKAHKELHRSSVEFFQGDLNDPKISELIPSADVVFCSGVLYHTPDPCLLLGQLRGLCNETLLLATATIPEMPGLKNMAVFYPYLNDRQRKIWARGGHGSQVGVGVPYNPEAGYVNWFWGLTPSCISAMLQCAGFTVERVMMRRPFVHLFVCHTTPLKPRPISDPTIYAHGFQRDRR
jgi:hypothetical protein